MEFIYIYISGGFGRGLGRDIYIYPVPVQYMFHYGTVRVLDIRGGLVGVWVRIYIYIAIPKVVRVWHFTVPALAWGGY